MSSTKVRSYDFDQVKVQVAGIELNGWAEDGGVEFEFGSDATDNVVGAGGEVVVNKSHDNRVYADITVMQTSRAATYLGELLQLQANTQAGPIPKVSFFCRNFNTGEKIQDPQCVFVSRPTPNQSQSAGERTFRLLLPQAAKNIVFGTTPQ